MPTPASRSFRIGTLIIWHANRFLPNTDEVNSFIRPARTAAAVFRDQGRGVQPGARIGRKELRDEVHEAEYESDHRGERVTLAGKRQARNGDYGSGVRPFDWGLDSGRPPAEDPNARAMERVPRFSSRWASCSLDLGALFRSARAPR